MPRPGDGAPRAVTLIPGDGLGPLVTGAVRQVMEAMHAPVYFETYDVHGDMPTVPPAVIDSIRRNKVCIKGGLATPVGGGVSSLNMQLRKELDLYASLVHCSNLPGLPTRHQGVDIVVIRENTEGEYSGLEHEVVPGVVESLKVRRSAGWGWGIGYVRFIHVYDDFPDIYYKIRGAAHYFRVLKLLDFAGQGFHLNK
jgi:isocitrate dehydrogenase (NAD+)